MNQIQEIISRSIDVKTALLSDESMIQKIGEAVNKITDAFSQGHRLYLCGNGGSAADAQHIAAEFTGRFYTDRKALPAEALHANTSYLTAVANDYSFEEVYARMVEGTLKPGDVLIGFSTSGNSTNIVNAFAAAKKMGVLTIAFTGASGGKLKELSDILLNIPSTDTPRIQESHIMVGHIICELVEKNMFG
ncbi:MAG: D-sedoheptulose 7-phosphate isomerase [Chitinophagaceae bacterium]|nr:D-sedoheptulose 7-phosphate isomerase [Chitinophagaceae bacterium]